MRRTIGYLFFYGGIIVLILGYVFHNRPPVPVGGYYVSYWVGGGVLGLVLALLGIMIAGPTRKK